MVSTYAEEGRMADEIGRKIAEVEAFNGDILAAYEKLAKRRDQLYSGDDAVYKASLGDARRDISDASDRLDAWKREATRFENECREMRSKAGKLAPEEKGRASGRLKELRIVLDVARARLISFDDRITDMLDRVLYITERH
jgi:predicted  nucleic acid-binding Zn-ribbon protein